MKKDEVEKIVSAYMYATQSTDLPATKSQLNVLETILLRELAPVDFLSILADQPVDIAMLHLCASKKAEATKLYEASLKFTKKSHGGVATNADLYALYTYAMSALNPSGELRFTAALASVSAFAKPGIKVLENYLFAKSIIPGKPYHSLIEKIKLTSVLY